MVQLTNFSKTEFIEKLETIKDILETSSSSFDVGISLHFVNEVLGELYDMEDIVED